LLYRATAIFLLVQQAVWLLVVLPGHTRGAWTVPGFAGDACCAPATAEAANAKKCCPKPQTPGKNDPAGRLSHCAVCHIAVRMVVAPPPDLVPSPSGPAERVTPAVAGAIPSLVLLRTYDSTGPPLA
jgi:hypothetical protein